MGIWEAILTIEAGRQKPSEPDIIDRAIDAVAKPLTKFITTAVSCQRRVSQIERLTGVNLLEDEDDEEE